MYLFKPLPFRSKTHTYPWGGIEGYFITEIRDSRGNMVRKTDTNGWWYVATYDKENRVTYEKNSQGQGKKYTYNENGSLENIEKS
jgi:YD repeat-containing protein